MEEKIVLQNISIWVMHFPCVEDDNLLPNYWKYRFQENSCIAYFNSLNLLYHSHSHVYFMLFFQNKQAWLGLASGSSARGILPFDGWANTVKSYICLGSFQRLFQRFLYFIRYNRFPLRSILAIFATITMLGELTANMVFWTYFHL